MKFLEMVFETAVILILSNAADLDIEFHRKTKIVSRARRRLPNALH